jgi:flagellar biosynthesis protein FlhA
LSPGSSAAGPDSRHAELRLPAPGRCSGRAWPGESERRARRRSRYRLPRRRTVAAETQEASWADVAPLDVLGLEVGYRLIPLVDKAQDGELLRRIRGIRKKFAQEVGFLVSPVHIRDNLELKPNAYRSCSRASRSAGRSFPRQSAGDQPGARCRPGAGHGDQGSGLRLAGGVDRYGAARAGAGLWLHGRRCQHGDRDASQSPDPVARRPSCSGARRRRRCSITWPRKCRSSSRIWCPKCCRLAFCRRSCRTCSKRACHIRDMRSIIESLSENAPRSQDAEVLTAQVRVAWVVRSLSSCYPSGSEMQVMSLDPQLERILQQAIAVAATMPVSNQVWLTPCYARPSPRRSGRKNSACRPCCWFPEISARCCPAFCGASIPHLKVLAHGEVPENRIIKVTSIIGGKV